VLYVSIEYATASHVCCCGCGNEIVTPFSPTDWEMTYDGETVSLSPSIGNWSFPCQSHYWIKRGKVRWARRWSKDEIEAGRAKDRALKARQFDAPELSDQSAAADSETEAPKTRVLGKLWRRVTNRLRL